MKGLCVDELLSLGLSMEDVAMTKGGVVFHGKVPSCYLANLQLRIANRLLMRIETFEATNFRQLKKKSMALPWELYLHNDAAVTFHVTTKHSRLFHSGAIKEQLEDSLAQRWTLAGGFAEKEPDISSYPQKVFVRAVDDRFAISIDSSGELLHKRGLKTHEGKAPIRETIAAAILTLAGYHGNEILVDPLCGTGTFSLEGAMMANRIPAGWYREFAFMGWPCFSLSPWRHIRNVAEKEIVCRKQPLIWASDIDQRSCHALKKTVLDNDLSGTICVFEKDFFNLLPSHIQEKTETKKAGMMVINPPYGRRLESKARSTKMFMEICKKLKHDFTGWKIALIAPSKKFIKSAPFPVATHDFFHGGLTMTLLTGRIH